MNKRVWKIIGVSGHGTEELDEFDNRAEALKMLREYRMAFGQQWILDIKRGRATV